MNFSKRQIILTADCIKKSWYESWCCAVNSVSGLQSVSHEFDPH